VEKPATPPLRPAGPDAGRVERERSQETVDVVGDAGLLGAGSALAGGQHLSAGGTQGGVFVVTQPDGHRANVAWHSPSC